MEVTRSRRNGSMLGLANFDLDNYGLQNLPPVRMSAGIVSIRDPEDLPTMLKRADSALYAAKRSGRDRTVSWPPERDPRALRAGEVVAA